MGPLLGLTVLAWMAVFSTPILALCSLVLEDGQIQAVTDATAAGWLSITYQSLVVVVIGYGCWYWLLRQYEVNQAMPFTLLIPPAGVASGVIFLGEALTWALVVGGLLTVAGVAIVVVRRPRLLHRGAKAP
jgi:O-acetylserine/cysteine efflux transporter